MWGSSEESGQRQRLKQKNRQRAGGFVKALAVRLSASRPPVAWDKSG
jgi:hypothetical protein